ncbi:MAG: hypothetical protein ACXWQO_14430 [Bdellovibrionota bacterium]
MKNKKEQKQKKISGPVPETSLPGDPDCTFEDIFVVPSPATPMSVDSTYVHEGNSFFARLFRKKGGEDRRKVA